MRRSGAWADRGRAEPAATETTTDRRAAEASTAESATETATDRRAAEAATAATAATKATTAADGRAAKATPATAPHSDPTAAPTTLGRSFIERQGSKQQRILSLTTKRFPPPLRHRKRRRASPSSSFSCMTRWKPSWSIASRDLEG
jgi:hypothetical protein